MNYYFFCSSYDLKCGSYFVVEALGTAPSFFCLVEDSKQTPQGETVNLIFEDKDVVENDQGLKLE